MGEFDISGAYARGVMMRRAVEETRDIIADRARRMEAEQKLSAMQQQLGELGASSVLSMARLREVGARAQSGDVSPEEIGQAFQQMGIDVTTLAGQALPIMAQTIASSPGNEYLRAGVSQIQATMTQGLQNIAELVSNAHQMRAEDQRLALARMTSEAQVRASDANAAQSYNAIAMDRAQNAREEQLQPGRLEAQEAAIEGQRAQTAGFVGDERRAGELHGAGMATAAAAATQAGAQARTATVEAGRAERLEKRDAAFNAIDIAERAQAFVISARQKGMAEDEIAAKTAELGFAPNELEELVGGLDEDAKDEMAVLRNRIAREQTDLKEGRGSQEDLDLYQRQYRRLGELQDKRHAARLRWDEMEQEDGSIATAWEKLKLVAKRRQFSGGLELLMRGPGQGLSGLRSLLEAAGDDDIIDGSGGELDPLLGSDYQPANPARRPSQVPSVREQTERGIRGEQ